MLVDIEVLETFIEFGDFSVVAAEKGAEARDRPDADLGVVFRDELLVIDEVYLVEGAVQGVGVDVRERVEVPEFDGHILGRRPEHSTVLVHVETLDGSCMALEAVDQLFLGGDFLDSEQSAVEPEDEVLVFLDEENFGDRIFFGGELIHLVNQFLFAEVVDIDIVEPVDVEHHITSYIILA